MLRLELKPSKFSTESFTNIQKPTTGVEMNTVFIKRLSTMKLYNTTSEYERVTIDYRSWNYHLQIHSLRK